MNSPVLPLSMAELSQGGPVVGVVQQRHSQLQCGHTVHLMLSLLQSILVLALHYGCQIWGMHTPTGETKAARAALQSIYDRFLRRICGVRRTPSAVLLEELALSPLQVFWWQRLRVLEHNCC